MVDDREVGAGANRFSYRGHWAYVASRDDGRALGTSTSSFHTGDTATITFAGTEVRVYGVRGLKGGYATLLLDGQRRSSTIDFYAPAVEAASLVYQSPTLPRGIHRLAVLVTGRRGPGGGNFVNIDYATITSPPTKMPMQ